MSSTRQLPLPFPTSILNIPCDREKEILGKMGDGVRQSAPMLLQERQRHHAFRWFPYRYSAQSDRSLGGCRRRRSGGLQILTGQLGNEPGKKARQRLRRHVLSRSPRGSRCLAHITSVTGSTTFTPVVVERIRIGARARGDRVEVINGHVTAHAVVHSDRTEEVGLPLQYP